MGILEYLNRPKKQKAGLTYNEKEHRFVITFDPDISKAEFMEVWSRFAEARKKTTGKSHVKKINQPKEILVKSRTFNSTDSWGSINLRPYIQLGCDY
jgi:hypothetical protein